jgi:Fur family ferric uptake transcriptional regulator
MDPKRPSSYNTRQRKRILDYMLSLGDAHVTVNQMARYFERENIPIGQTTIYRHLEKLAAEGKIRKYSLGNDNGACYQFVTDAAACGEHFHLICETCGRLIHLDCEMLGGIQQHLLADHRFQLNTLKTVFYGKCETCAAG